MANNETVRFLLPGAESELANSRAFGPASRGGAIDNQPLLEGVTLRRHYDLSLQQRAPGNKVATPPLAADDVLALEMEDGFILYTSAGRLADDILRKDPDAGSGGTIDLEALRGRTPASRSLGSWTIRALTVLGVDDTWLRDKALEKAREWGVESLLQGVSWAGTKALMWAIEERAGCAPGSLHAWGDGTTVDSLSPVAADFGNNGEGQRMLLFIHGVGSSTLGSFGELRQATAEMEWKSLRRKFGRHIYAFEHRTLSESPIENALQLVRQLPRRAKLSVVTHSRGGLVADLLCTEAFDVPIDTCFTRHDSLFEHATEEHRKMLGELRAVLADKQFVIERYVRVACPAQGTLLASAHFDAFLSGLLHLIGMVPALAGTAYYAAFKRIVLQIAKNRTDPHLVPGIEAMLPDSPLTALLGHARPKDNARIAVIAGDIEGGGLLKRIGVFLTDYLLFEREDNDLVVDTESMFGGIARKSGFYVFDQGEDVNHFRYFAHARTRRALHAWLTREEGETLPEFRPIMPGKDLEAMQRGQDEVSGTSPVAVFLPGIMGSHLSLDNDRIWFDVVDIALGELPVLAWPGQRIKPDGVFQKFYGKLCTHLARSHDVVRFDYDWRAGLEETADRLAVVIDALLVKTEQAKQPVRLMTHSMGGLVVRAMIQHRPDIWERLMARDGGRWIMLGTPNNGSHGAVETLLGLSGAMRKLAMLDWSLGLQGVVDLMAGFPGALQLLPRPGFADTGGVRHDYYTRAFWAGFKKGNDSRVFGDDIGAVPDAALLASASEIWKDLDRELPNPDRIAYVAGYGRETPCGIERETGGHSRLRMIGTLNGDGTVTHDSGLLDVLKRHRRVWFMDADHAGLTSTEAHFPALLELLEHGETLRLPQSRPALRGAEVLFRYEPGPVLYPAAFDLERALIGGTRLPPRETQAVRTLQVSCRAMDLRHAVHPILVGHYEGDAISAAEAQIDRHVVNNRLTLRHHLDTYAGPLGSVAVVLDEQNEAQEAAGIRRGAIVIGLGTFGELKTADLANAVRQGALRYLLQLYDRMPAQECPKPVGVASLLLGHNSTTRISIDESVMTVVRAVMEANRDFGTASGSPLHIGRIEFIEIFEDVAISAAKAVRSLGERLARDATRLGFRLEPAQILECGIGMRPRLEAISAVFDYWPRLVITADAEPGTDTDGAPATIASKLNYMYLSARARAVEIVQTRQPGLIENLLDKSVRFPHFHADFARSLFHLLLPHEFKDMARQAGRLVIAVDELTANLPWEMLVADNEPLIRTTAIVRQFSSPNFRSHARSTRSRRAYVIGNPSTAGFQLAFRRDAGRESLPDLPGAAAEARAVADLVKAAGYEVVEAAPGSEGTGVINKLYTTPYRIVHVSAHGVFQAGPSGNQRTGVVLSDGLLLTAAEIAALEVLPDLVFLNCCHSGRIDAGPETAYNRLAGSVARELIENGVRAVIVAGWAVDDNAARHFAEEFYRRFLGEGAPFGRSVHEARVSTYECFHDSNTWGAFQAYGEPSFVMDPENSAMRGEEDFRPVAPQEVVARIEMLCNELAHLPTHDGVDGERLRESVAHLLRRGAASAWTELPAVLYPLARFHADAGDFTQAQQCYERAITLEDRRGQVPVLAIEQLANMEVRYGADLAQTDYENGEKRLRQGLNRLLGLAMVTGGTESPEEAQVNAERCALIGSAFKRLAGILPSWDGKAGVPEPSGARQALEAARDWYRRGQGSPGGKDFNIYNALNRIALDAVLGNSQPKDGAGARDAGKMAQERYEQTRDYFDLVMSAEGELIGALVDRSLDPATEARISARYEQLRVKLPETERGFDSVVMQVRLLAQFYRRRGATGHGESERLAKALDRIALSFTGALPCVDHAACPATCPVPK